MNFFCFAVSVLHSRTPLSPLLVYSQQPLPLHTFVLSLFLVPPLPIVTSLPVTTSLLFSLLHHHILSVSFHVTTWPLDGDGRKTCVSATHFSEFTRSWFLLVTSTFFWSCFQNKTNNQINCEENFGFSKLVVVCISRLTTYDAMCVCDCDCSVEEMNTARAGGMTARKSFAAPPKRRKSGGKRTKKRRRRKVARAYPRTTSYLEFTEENRERIKHEHPNADVRCFSLFFPRFFSV